MPRLSGRLVPIGMFFYEFVISSLVPRFVYAPKMSQSGVIPIENPPIQMRQRQQLLRRCLLLNLSFMCEPKFRLNLYRELSTWNSDPLEHFDDVKARLESLLRGRSRLTSRLVPSEGLATTLCAFGFFSLAPKLNSGGASWFNLNPLALTGRFRTWRKAPSLYGEVIQDVRKIRRQIEGPLSTSTVNFVTHHSLIASANGSASSSIGRSLIIGPSPVHVSPDKADFTKVFLVTTLSENPVALRSKILTFRGTPVLADGFCAHILGNGVLKKQLIDALQLAEEIVCSRAWHERLREVLTAELVPLESNLSLLFSSGAPLGLQRTIGVAMRMNLDVEVLGASMYTSALIYQEGSQISAQSMRASGNVDYHFQACLGLAGHDPIANFLVAKKLSSGGRIIGGDEFVELVTLSLDEYLLKLEEAIGKRRS